MKIYTEISLQNFEFWSGAKETAKHLTVDDFATIESVLEDCYTEGLDETTVNDIFWFEEDWIAEMLGYEDWEDLLTQRGEKQ